VFIRFIAAFVAFALALLNTGCGSSIQGEMTPTTTPFVITPTLPGSLPPHLSETPLPPSPQPTVAPVDGVTTTQVNVRLEPSTAGNVLGIIPADMRVEIIGKDPAGNWWQINYLHPDAIDGKGWVTAQYITTGDTSQVSVIGGTEADPTSGNIAVVQQQINVRSGPGTGFNSLGTLNPEDVLLLTGKDPNGAWLQIDFEVGPEGKGWVNAAFVQAQGVENLPIIAESGAVIGTGTPTGLPPTPTLTLIPAWEDNDSSDSPIASVIFEPAGTQTFIYTGDLSAPQGDLEDWIAFQPYDRLVFASLECKGSATVEGQLLENGLPGDTYIECGAQMQEIAVYAGSNYLLHLRVAPSAVTLQYANYTLKIKTRP
jgi:uncharacterized protein YraI